MVGCLALSLPLFLLSLLFFLAFLGFLVAADPFLELGSGGGAGLLS